MAFEYLDAEMQRMSQDHEHLVRRTKEMPLLRSTFIDQKLMSAALKDQLTRSPDIHFMSVVQEIEKVSVIHDSTITDTTTGTHTEHLGSSTRKNQVQQTSLVEDVFINQQTELISFRSEPVDYRYFQSASKHQVSRTTEIRIVQEFEEVSVIHNPKSIRSSSAANRVTDDPHVISFEDGQQNQSQPRKWSPNSGHSTAIIDFPAPLRTGDTHVVSSDDEEQAEPIIGLSYSHLKKSGSSLKWSRNRDNSTGMADPEDVHTLRPKCKERSDQLETDDIRIVSSDDKEQHQRLSRPSYSHSKRSGKATQKKLARKCSWNRGYLTIGSSAKENEISHFRTDETHGISADDKSYDQLPDPSLPRPPNAKQSESSKRKKKKILVSQCRRSDRNKKDNRIDSTPGVKTSNESPKRSLNLRREAKPYTCAECDKRFSTKQKLASHLRIHSGEKPYQCKTCNRAFSQSISLTVHLRTHSGEKPYQCKTCNRAFSDSSNLAKHLRTHSGEKPYQCEICNRAFSNSSNLTVHLRTHSGEKPYQCEICNRAFSDSSNLAKHLRTHSGEKPYQCKICNRAFSNSSNLTVHLRTHSGEKPYQCEICNRAFSQSISLTVHLRTHSGEKPYQCKICNRAFSQSISLTVHLRTHSGEKPYQCKICNRAFSRSGTLTEHLKTHPGTSKHFERK